MTELCNKTGFK